MSYKIKDTCAQCLFVEWKNIQQNGIAKIGNPQPWKNDQSATEEGSAQADSATEKSETSGGDWYCENCGSFWKIVEIV